MSAYNAINGQPACASEFLLQQTLRGAWNFRGYVLSDCDAVRNIFRDHHYRPTQPQASAISLIPGMDNECIDFAKVTDDHDYHPYIDAVQQGYLPEGTVDTALIRLFTARIRLGMFDPPEMVLYSKIDEKILDSADHRALARKMANESMVLLRNDGVPLKTVKRIAVVGPLADQTAVLLGNYNGAPTHTVSVLEGMKAEFPQAKITYVPGTQFLSNHGDPVPASALTTPDGKPGLKAEYGSRPGFDSQTTPLASRIESVVNLTESNMPEQAKSIKTLSVKWSGLLNPLASGDYGQTFLAWTFNTHRGGEEQALVGLSDHDGTPSWKYVEFKQIASEFVRLQNFGVSALSQTGSRHCILLRKQYCVSPAWTKQYGPAIFHRRLCRPGQKRRRAFF
jgi:beta-glucosidase